MGSEGIRWGGAPSVGGSRRVLLWRPRPAEVVTAVAVAAVVHGLWLHWVHGRTVPCLGEQEGCPYHDGRDDWGLRWKGYLAAVRDRGLLVGYLEITEDAYRTCPDLAQLSEAGHLRGVRVAVRRGRGGDRRPCRVELPQGVERVEWADRLPRCPDVRAALSVLFSAARRGVRNAASADAPEDGHLSGL